MSPIPALRTVTVLSAAFVLSVTTQAASAHDRVPRDYVVWRSADAGLCEAINTRINKLPDQDISRASQSGAAGFLKWSGQPTYIDRLSAEGAKSFFPVTTTTVVLESASLPSRILRYSGMVAGTPTDALYVLPPGAKLPKDGNELRDLLGAKRPDFSSYEDGEMQRLQETHGKDWKQWDLHGQVTVHGLEIRRQPYFLAEEVSPSPDYASSILVFSLNTEGVQRDLCILRRVRVR